LPVAHLQSPTPISSTSSASSRIALPLCSAFSTSLLILSVHFSGIDLASPSELVAHERDRFAIAKHIGAEEVIYQGLDDLKSCCAKLSPRETQDFEVGVFCGKYITPVPEGYFEHLEDLRGQVRASAPAAGASTLAANSGAMAATQSNGVASLLRCSNCAALLLARISGACSSAGAYRGSGVSCS